MNIRQGTSVDLTITGQYFADDARPVFSGWGIAVLAVVVVSATEITATIHVAPNARLGPRPYWVESLGQRSEAQSITIEAPPPRIVATGGTITDADGYRIHTFDASGDFVVTDAEDGAEVEWTLIASGGTGGRNSSAASGVAAGGGGGGEVVEDDDVGGPTAISAQTYPIVVGASVAGPTTLRDGFNGNDSSAFGYTAKGGGAGVWQLPANGKDGGNGGGAGAQNNTSGVGGAANGTVGFRGGHGVGTPTTRAGGGGGGAGENGGDAVGTTPGDGGDGRVSKIDGVRYGGGGGGQSSTGAVGAGGLGGGTAGGSPSAHCTANTGGGSGASVTGQPGSSGSGRVLIRYRI